MIITYLNEILEVLSNKFLILKDHKDLLIKASDYLHERLNSPKGLEWLLNESDYTDMPCFFIHGDGQSIMREIIDCVGLPFYCEFASIGIQKTTRN